MTCWRTTHLLLCSILVSIGTITVSACNCYVSNNATVALGEGSINAPFKTVAQCVADGGTHICLLAGIYNEHVTIPASLKLEGIGQVSLTAGLEVIGSDTEYNSFHFINLQFVGEDSLKVQDPIFWVHASDVNKQLEVHQSTIENCKFILRHAWGSAFVLFQNVVGAPTGGQMINLEIKDSYFLNYGYKMGTWPMAFFTSTTKDSTDPRQSIIKFSRVTLACKGANNTDCKSEMIITGRKFSLDQVSAEAGGYVTISNSEQVHVTSSNFTGGGLWFMSVDGASVRNSTFVRSRVYSGDPTLFRPYGLVIGASAFTESKKLCYLDIEYNTFADNITADRPKFGVLTTFPHPLTDPDNRTVGNVRIGYNDFSGVREDSFAITNTYKFVYINATLNWFGSAKGPTYDCHVGGPRISLVDVSPWCGDDSCDSVIFAPPCGNDQDLPWLVMSVMTGIALFLVITISVLWVALGRRVRVGVPIMTESSSLLYSDPILSDLEELLERLSLTVIDKSDLEMFDVIGNGSFGNVYKGYWRSRDITVAVKKVGIIGTTRSDKQFFREIKIMAGLNHPNIISLVGVCLTDTGSTLLVLEFMSQGSLADIIHKKKHRLQYSQILRIAQDIAYGMHYLHSITPKVVHRDLKPDNILLDDTGAAKVGDFGISRALKKRSKTMKIRGTPDYMAPESIASSKFSEKSDVYSYGMILWELFAHERPFTEYKDPIQVMFLVSREGLKPEMGDDWPPNYRQLILDCLDSKPTVRPSFKTIIDRLKTIDAIDNQNRFFTDSSNNNISNPSSLKSDIEPTLESQLIQ